MDSDKKIYDEHGETIDRIRDIIRNTNEIIDSGAENAFQRMLVYVACNMEPSVECIKYTKWTSTVVCKYHKKKLVWNTENICCGDIMCFGRCPNADYYNCHPVRAKIKEKNNLAVYNKDKHDYKN